MIPRRATAWADNTARQTQGQRQTFTDQRATIGQSTAFVSVGRPSGLATLAGAGTGSNAPKGTVGTQQTAESIKLCKQQIVNYVKGCRQSQLGTINTAVFKVQDVENLNMNNFLCIFECVMQQCLDSGFSFGDQANTDKKKGGSGDINQNKKKIYISTLKAMDYMNVAQVDFIQKSGAQAGLVQMSSRQRFELIASLAFFIQLAMAILQDSDMTTEIKQMSAAQTFNPNTPSRRRSGGRITMSCPPPQSHVLGGGTMDIDRQIYQIHQQQQQNGNIFPEEVFTQREFFDITAKWFSQYNTPGTDYDRVLQGCIDEMSNHANRRIELNDLEALQLVFRDSNSNLRKTVQKKEEFSQQIALFEKSISQYDIAEKKMEEVKLNMEREIIELRTQLDKQPYTHKDVENMFSEVKILEGKLFQVQKELQDVQRRLIDKHNDESDIIHELKLGASSANEQMSMLSMIPSTAKHSGKQDNTLRVEEVEEYAESDDDDEEDEEYNEMGQQNIIGKEKIIEQFNFYTGEGIEGLQQQGINQGDQQMNQQMNKQRNKGRKGGARLVPARTHLPGMQKDEDQQQDEQEDNDEYEQRDINIEGGKGIKRVNSKQKQFKQDNQNSAMQKDSKQLQNNYQGNRSQRRVIVISKKPSSLYELRESNSREMNIVQEHKQQDEKLLLHKKLKSDEEKNIYDKIKQLVDRIRNHKAQISVIVSEAMKGVEMQRNEAVRFCQNIQFAQPPQISQPSIYQKNGVNSSSNSLRRSPSPFNSIQGQLKTPTYQGYTVINQENPQIVELDHVEDENKRAMIMDK
ncbi:MAG: hypothetical protein EZS28_015082 [Streblomastix strix]|uniref:Uncharacterized protein n=1 Tax=Streblomastix strix TaxID=222440 RepID=A0A5J4W3Z7_9EUKA|nr:MAG: hypothetical protein EZS28_015082 [Streblomastix strix]